VHTALEVVAAIVLGLLLCWLALVLVLWRLRPRSGVVTEALRAVPDVVRLTHRLAGDRTLPRSLRVWLWLLLAYLASPIDLVPDFIPVIGYAAPRPATTGVASMPSSFLSCSGQS
jgi:hypothetical protein